MIKYKTEQRKILLDFLIKNKKKFISAEEILIFMKNNNQDVGLTTIYRFLKELENDNSVRIEIKEHTKYFQYVENDNSNHMFLKCKKCGKSLDLGCHEVEELNHHINEEHKFKLDSNTIIYGTCNKCSK